MEKGTDRILRFFDIYPKEYTNVPYAYGCYEKNGKCSKRIRNMVKLL